MRPYQDLSGNSGVTAYEITPTSIKIRFGDEDAVYVYDHKKPGRKHVEEMKRLAVAGRGLATYVNQNVQKNFAEKLAR
jgi:hypothetical protein